MKYLIYSLFLTMCSYAIANTPYEIPRSTVVELKEPDTKRIYPIFIKVPRSYENNKRIKYPVIYLTDANANFQMVSGSTRFPMDSGEIKEAIIVGISYSKGSKGSSSRVRDFTPENAKDWKLETGNANGHAKFIREVVFPYIESNYRARAKDRTFLGHSLGGLFGVYILFNYPDMFGNYILGSPSVWFKNDLILSVPAVKISSMTKIYLSVGGLEMPEHGERESMVEGARNLSNKIKNLKSEKVSFKFTVVEGASHATVFPTVAIQGLAWVYGERK